MAARRFTALACAALMQLQVYRQLFLFDPSSLIHLLHPDANPSEDPAKTNPVEKAQERIEHLVQTLEGTGETVIIPTPALAGFLVEIDHARSITLLV